MNLLKERYKDYIKNLLVIHDIKIIIILLLLIGFFIFKDYLLLKKLYIFLDIGSDSYNRAYPNFSNIADYIRNEGIPFWSFFQGMGQNIFPAEINNPFNLILYLLGREFIPYGIAYVELLKMILAGVIFCFYLRTLSFSSYTCTIGGILFAFSGYMVLGSGWYGHSTFIVTGIFFIFSFEKLFNQGVWYYFPLSVAFVASRSAFYLYILGFFLLLYSIFRIIDTGKLNKKEVLKLYAKMIGLGALGLAMVAPFLVNDLLRMLESPRVGGDAGYSGKLMSGYIFSFGDYYHNITAILRLFSNDILGTGSDFKGWYNYLEAPNFYCGLSTLLLFPQIFYFLDKKRKVIFSGFLFIWILVIVFPFLRHALYLFTGNYYKGGLSFIIPFTMLLYSLHAFDQIDKNHSVNKVLLIATFIILIGILYFPYFSSEQSPINESARLLITAFLLIYTILFSFFRKTSNTKLLRFSLLIIICIEAYMFSFITTNSRLVLTADELKLPVGYNDETVKILEIINSKDDGFFRVNKSYSSGQAVHVSFNDALIQKYYGTTSYYQFNQKYYIRFLAEAGIIESDHEEMTRWAIGLTSRPLLRTFASVKYHLSKKEVTDFIKHTYRPYIWNNAVTAYQNNYFLPLGFTYNKYTEIEKFRKLDQLQKDMLLLKAFVVEDDIDDFHDFKVFNIDTLKDNYSYSEYKNDIASLRQESLVLTHHGQNKIKGTIKVDKRKLLFFSIPFDKGWTLKIDGRKQKLRLINMGFMGVIISKGSHEVELKFVPPFFFPGIIIMIGSVILYGFLLINRRR